jgi:hypothetical protein
VASADLGQVLLDAEQGLERITALLEPVEDRPDPPGSGLSPGSSSSAQPIGTDTGAPAEGRVEYGATSVLLIAFWV